MKRSKQHRAGRIGRDSVDRIILNLKCGVQEALPSLRWGYWLRLSAKAGWSRFVRVISSSNWLTYVPFTLSRLITPSNERKLLRFHSVSAAMNMESPAPARSYTIISSDSNQIKNVRAEYLHTHQAGAVLVVTDWAPPGWNTEEWTHCISSIIDTFYDTALAVVTCDVPGWIGMSEIVSEKWWIAKQAFFLKLLWGHRNILLSPHGVLSQIDKYNWWLAGVSLWMV